MIVIHLRGTGNFFTDIRIRTSRIHSLVSCVSVSVFVQYCNFLQFGAYVFCDIII